MPKTRLTNEKREKIVTYACSIVLADDEIAAEKAAYKALLKQFKIEHKKSFPEREMKVLRKYDNLEKIRHLKFYLTYPDKNPKVLVLQLKDEIDSPTKDSWESCPLGEFTEESLFYKLWKTHDDSVTALKARNRSICSDFTDLTYGAKTFEDVAEVWPEVENLRDKLCGVGTAISTITEEQRLRIKDYKVTTTKPK